jgi:hypothetical protein
MAIWSSTITSWPGSYVDGQDGQNEKAAKKKFSFPGMTTSVSFPKPPDVGPLYCLARSVTLVVTDNKDDPNFFDVDFEFEVQSTVRGVAGGCIAHGHLFESNPATNPDQQAVSDFTFRWVIECGIHLVRHRLPQVRAVRYAAAKRAQFAWFYFVADEDGQEVCPGVSQ